jgi:hypothetical protein
MWLDVMVIWKGKASAIIAKREATGFLNVPFTILWVLRVSQTPNVRSVQQYKSLFSLTHFMIVPIWPHRFSMIQHTIYH